MNKAKLCASLVCAAALAAAMVPAVSMTGQTDAQAITTCSSCHKGTPSGTQPTKQTIKVSKTSASYKVKALKKSAKSFKIGAKARGSISCSKSSGSSNVTVSSKGKVTVKKGTPFGLYTVSVSIRAASYGHFNPAVKTVTVKIKVS